MNPNKIFVVEYTGSSMIGNTYRQVVIAASNKQVAQKHVKNIIGIDVEPIWLMNATYPTIYVGDGSVPKEIQAKILYNGGCYYRE